MGDCPCAAPPRSRARGRPPYPRMGLSSMQPRSMQLPRSLPLPPRPSSPQRMLRPVPGPSRGSHCPSPECLDRNLVATTRSPDFAKLGSTMEELSKLEFVEMENIEEDLRDFHMKRRKLVFNIASINMSKARKSIKNVVSKMGL